MGTPQEAVLSHAIRTKVRPMTPRSVELAQATTPTPDFEPWIGAMIGKRHRIVRHVASGGMGHVFLGQHTTLGGWVAIKMLFDGRDAEATRYFCNEARLLAHLRHPNIVGVVDCGVLESGVYIVMEWLPGEDLGSYLASNGPLPPMRALWILSQLASALDYIHGKGIVHRDIKPENVIFHPEAYDAVKLFDFGVAVPFRAPPSCEDDKVIGTPLYMAPEQAAGCPPTPSTDLYALGALALELMTGHAAYARSSPSEIVASVLTSPPSLPSDHGLCVPGLDEVIAKAMARDPKDRFATGLAFIEALRAVLSAESAEPQAPALPRASRPSPPSMKPTTVWSEPPRAPRLDMETVQHRLRPPPSPSAFGVLAACCFALAAWLVPL